MEKKQDIRKQLLKIRNLLSEPEHEKYSKIIAGKVCCSQWYLNADTLLIYISYQKEAVTYEIITKALQDGKEIYCPKVLGPGNMEFYKITSLQDVVCGYKNIPEPAATDQFYAKKEGENVLMIMPLVGYDIQKNRIGYGGGFYDRYLQRFPEIKKIALGFECQRWNGLLPAEETDLKPDFIITEETEF